MTPTGSPPKPSGPPTTWPASTPACPTATADAHHNRTAPTPNACLTCPDFQTTPAFLDIHRRQHDETRQLIATAEADGQLRLADNHRQVHDNLNRLIAALEDTADTTP